MNGPQKQHLMRLRVALIGFSVVVAGFAWLAATANPTGRYVGNNVAPAAAAWVLLVWILMRQPVSPRWWLGWVGFLVPALGLSGYVHLAFLNDWRGIASGAVTPELLFFFLPIYAAVAGGIGFAIGWIVGRALAEHRRVR
ncbi:MAG: hypothetical protein AAF350_12070 [Pseudomonadota bacterium]